MSAIRYLFAAVMLSSAVYTQAQSLPRIAIIIDDLGYQYAAGQRAIDLPGPVSYAILPATPSGRLLARAAHDKGKEVLLHLPLESVGHAGPDEPGGITLDMTRRAFREAFEVALESVPYAIGVSSHRGSLLTRHPGHMQWLMQEISAHEGMFFVDSYTTPASVALQVAAESGVAANRRHVFLDNDRSPEALSHEFDRLTVLARRRGVAIAIGHPYPETLSFLEHRLAQLDVDAVQLIPVSEAIRFLEPGRTDQL
jgi:polysaccharide deacetylase 2 family uncharacterized protein YibQ